MQQIDSNHKYYVMLKGSWRTDDGLCTAEFSGYPHVKVEYGGGVMDSSYNVCEVDPFAYMQPVNSFGMMGMNAAPHPNERLRFMINNHTVYADGKTLFSITAWYTIDDVLHFEIMDLNDGSKKEITLTRDKTDDEVPVNVFDDNGNYHCQCGYKGPASKFCPECGKQI